MQRLSLLLSRRSGRLGLLIGLAIGFVISMIRPIIREVRSQETVLPKKEPADTACQLSDKINTRVSLATSGGARM